MEIELIQKYLDGDAAPDQERELLDWLSEAEANRVLFTSMLALKTAREADSGEKDLEERTERVLSRVNARIDADERAVSRPRRLLSSPWTGWFVAATAVLAVVFLLVRPEVKPQEERLILPEIYENTTSSVRPFTLGDGTKAYLTPGASIACDVTGQPGRRSVLLKGEAYFDVAPDTLRPLTVDAGVIKVEVLGTAFSVRNGGGVTDTDIVLERGSVRVLSPGGERLFNLKPNQRATVFASNSDILVEDMFAIPYITEKYNLVSALNATLPEILSLIERNYGVRIRCDRADTERHFNVNFLKSDPLKDVIEIVEYISGCHLAVSGGV